MAVVRAGCELSRERTARHIARHHHLAPYAALVLRGGYVEAGDRGRFRASAGDVLLHGAFEAHQDRFDRNGADILNLPIERVPDFAYGRARDPDAVVRLAESDGAEAAALLLATIVPLEQPKDWPDLLAADLRRGRVASLAAWAAGHGLAPSSVSRGFRMNYGISPQGYRAEQRASAAARAIQSGSSLAAAAAEEGFADQPHMTRTIRRVFDTTPRALRPSVNCVQDEAAPRR